MIFFNHAAPCQSSFETRYYLLIRASLFYSNEKNVLEENRQDFSTSTKNYRIQQGNLIFYF